MDVEEIDREIDDIMYQIEDESEGNGVGWIKEESQEQRHHYGYEYFEPKMEVKLVKEPDNEYDKEAIKVEVEGLGLVKYVLPRGVLCEMVLNCEENGGEE